MGSQNNKTTLNNYLRFEDTELSPEDFKRVKAEINESDESRRNGLKELRERLSNVPDLNACLEEEFLLKFLRVGKFNVQRAFDRVIKYYKCVNNNPSYFKDNYSKTIDKSRELRMMFVAPYRMPDNSALLILRYGRFHPAKISFEEMFLTMVFVNNYAQSKLAQMCGLTFLVEYTGLSVAAMLAHTPYRLKIECDYFANVVPMRIKASHMVKTPPIFSLLYRIGYPFLPKKIQQRLLVHPNNDNWKSLHSKIPPEILPEEFGGKLPDSSLLDPFDDLEVLQEKFKKSFPMIATDIS